MCFHFSPAGLSPDGIIYRHRREKPEEQCTTFNKNNNRHHSAWRTTHDFIFQVFIYETRARKPAPHVGLGAPTLHREETKTLMNVDF